MTDRDPAVEQWRAGTEKSTGALLREALDANQALAVENERLRAEIAELRVKPRARRPGQWQLTDKAIAALDAEDKP